jgi:adenylate cyclase, class 2
MHYEIEQKYRCDDLARIRVALVALGAEAGEIVEQADCYYKHPQRDFAKTDEAFRLRRVGQRNYMTYKGPKIDATTKSRFEEEVRLADGEVAWHSCDEIVRHLGFEPVAIVSKRRETLHLAHNGATIEAALDNVVGVGTFVELEVAVDFTSNDMRKVDAAKRALAEVAAQLGLADAERRSYLELLLAARS